MVDEAWVRRCAENPGAEWRLEIERDGQKVEVQDEGRFDELVVDHWLHVENLSERSWWLRIGDVRIEARVDSGGDVTVNVVRGFYSPVTGTTEVHQVPE